MGEELNHSGTEEGPKKQNRGKIGCRVWGVKGRM